MVNHRQSNNNNIGKGKDPNKLYTRQLLSPLRLMPDSILKSRMATLLVIPSVYIVGMTSHGVEYPFNPFRSPVPTMLPLSFVCITPPLPLWQSMRQGKKKSLI